jgi:hypothetical protein
MTTESVTRCDGCGEEQRGEVRGWLRLEAHGTQTDEARSWWVAGVGSGTLPLHFHSLGCLRGWIGRQRQTP